MTPKQDRELAELKAIFSQVKGRADALNLQGRVDALDLKENDTLDLKEKDEVDDKNYGIFVIATVVSIILITASVGSLIFIINLITEHM